MVSRISRSFLFVPGNRPDRFDKAVQSGAHQVIIDMEDAVAPEAKDAARANVAAWGGRAEAIIRINGVDSPWFGADLEMVRQRGVTTVMLPKASPGALDAMSDRLADRCRIVALIETVEGYASLRSIGKNRAVAQLAFGNLDFGVDAGVTEIARELDPVRLQIVLESRLANLPAPIDGVSTSWTDMSAFSLDVRKAKALGFGGKLCIHPAQVQVANESFLPTREEIAWASRVLDAIAAGGSGAITLDGKMIDRPVADRARTVLASRP